MSVGVRVIVAVWVIVRVGVKKAVGVIEGVQVMVGDGVMEAVAVITPVQVGRGVLLAAAGWVSVGVAVLMRFTIFCPCSMISPRQ